MAFQYEPLPGSAQFIRLIRMQPISTDSDFWSTPECEIRTEEATPDTVYHALSYVWGDPRAEKIPINIAGRSHFISHNLYNLLCYFRARGTDEWIWADQICINQEDVEERNYVVQFMSTIYQNATFVIAWIGCNDHDVAAAASVSTLIRAIGYGNINGNRTQLATLMSNEYFTRLWIIQEVLLARSAVMMCGHCLIPFQELEIVLRHTIAIGDVVNNCSPYLLWDMKFGMQHHRHLIECIDRYSDNECERTHDRVYALLGLVDPSWRIRVDYNKTAHDVFIEVVLKFSGGCVHTRKERDRYVDILLRLGGRMGVISLTHPWSSYYPWRDYLRKMVRMTFTWETP